MENLRPILTNGQLRELQKVVDSTFLSDSVVNYIVSLISATRSSGDLSRGASPRGTLAVAAMAKSIAQLRGRDYVVPGDVREVLVPTLAHRLIRSPRAESQGKSMEQILKEIQESVPVPKLR